jgi:hypothetical protein
MGKTKATNFLRLIAFGLVIIYFSFVPYGAGSSATI